MKKVYACIFLTGFLFATMEVSLKVAGTGMDSFQLTFLRFFIGGLIILPFAIAEMKKNKVRIGLKDIGFLTVVGITGIPLSMLFFQLGVMECNASTASVLICINPLFTMVFAHFILNEKMNRGKLIVLALGLAGVVFMIRPWDLQEGNSVIGIVYMMLASIFFGLYTCIGKISTAKVGTFAQTSLSFILGSLVLLVIILFMGRPVTAGIAANWLEVMYISVFVTGLGYISYFTAIRLSDAVTGSIAFFIKPAIAPVIAVIVLHDAILWNTVAGIVLILGASYLNIHLQRKSFKAKEITDGDN